MWPIGGLLSGASTELLVPGQDSPVTWTSFAGWPNTAYTGVYINVATGGAILDGRLARRNNSNYTQQTNMWIHQDAWTFVDANDYEFRYVNVTGDTGSLNGSPWEGTTYGPEDGWQSGHLNPDWYVTATGPQFGSDISEVNGFIQVREKADTSNIRTGDLTLRATYEGES